MIRDSVQRHSNQDGGFSDETSLARRRRFNLSEGRKRYRNHKTLFLLGQNNSEFFCLSTKFFACSTQKSAFLADKIENMTSVNSQTNKFLHRKRKVLAFQPLVVIADSLRSRRMMSRLLITRCHRRSLMIQQVVDENALSGGKVEACLFVRLLECD